MSIFPPQEAQVVAIFLLDVELVIFFLSTLHMRAVGCFLNRMRTPVRLFLMSGPVRRCSLRIVPLYLAEQANTTLSFSGFLGVVHAMMGNVPCLFLLVDSQTQTSVFLIPSYGIPPLSLFFPSALFLLAMFYTELPL